MKSTILAGALMLAAPAAFAQAHDMERENLSDELLTCAAYFHIVRDGMLETPGGEELAANSEHVGDILFASAYLQRKENTAFPRSEETLNRLVTVVYASEKERLLDEIERRYENLAIISDQYAIPCFQMYTSLTGKED